MNTFFIILSTSSTFHNVFKWNSFRALCKSSAVSLRITVSPALKSYRVWNTKTAHLKITLCKPIMFLIIKKYSSENIPSHRYYKGNNNGDEFSPCRTPSSWKIHGYIIHTYFWLDFHKLFSHLFNFSISNACLKSSNAHKCLLFTLKSLCDKKCKVNITWLNFFFQNLLEFL